jgi:excinuclease ABC subunit C
VSSLPECPGSYQYYDDSGKIIYVGKAINLRRRVYSYFTREQNRKTTMLVSKIQDIKYIVVKTEEDALLLENSLIKKYKPRYNVLLKDDKTYPSICITNEPFPRVFKTRRIIKNGATYFGPYSHIGIMNAVLSLIKHLYPIRTCNFVMTEEGVRQGKYKSCLEFHIKNCLAPCIGKQSREDYAQNIAEIKEILKGNTAALCRQLREMMQHYAEELKFEEAEAVKQKYLALENYRSKSEVVSNQIENCDVFAIEEEENSAYINYLHVYKGNINQAFTFEYKKKLNETREELLILGIIEMRARYKSTAKEIVVPFDIELNMENIKVTVPKKGDKKTLIDLAEMNVKQYKVDRLKQAEKLNPEQKSVRLMKELQQKLHLEKMPMQIECFDNSNISGTSSVAACVVFKKAKPSKQDYRKYNIRTVVGPDDYASMAEVVKRRYERLQNENQPLPDLIITDGGRGQMDVVRAIVEDQLHLHIPIAGLAKNDKHRTNELLFGFPPVTVGLKTDSELFKLLTRIQDEVHRFAITFHRDKRSKAQTHSELDTIKGIGEKTKTMLLRKFKSVKVIHSSSYDEIAEVIGTAKAKIITDYFAHKLP